MNKENKKVYLAGKVRQNGWRHDIVEGLRNSSTGTCFADIEVGANMDGGLYWSEEDTINLNMGEGYTYVGPILVGCDHGCYHGATQHGAISAMEETKTTRTDTFTRNQKALERADVVVAYIDSLDCYGTYLELGYAYAKGKPIHIIYSYEVFKQLEEGAKPHFDEESIDFPNRGGLGKQASHELWYLDQMATTVRTDNTGLEYAIKSVLTKPKKFIGHTSCDKCGGEDSIALYTDSESHCYACGVTVKVVGNV